MNNRLTNIPPTRSTDFRKNWPIHLQLGKKRRNNAKNTRLIVPIPSTVHQSRPRNSRYRGVPPSRLENYKAGIKAEAGQITGERSNSLESRRNDVTNEKVSLLYVRLFHCPPLLESAAIALFRISSSPSASKAGVCCRTRNERKYGAALESFYRASLRAGWR